MKVYVCLVALCLVAGIVLYALRCKGDVKAAFKFPFVEFSLETKDKNPPPQPAEQRPNPPGRPARILNPPRP